MNTQIDKDGPLAWAIARDKAFCIAEFTIRDENGILSPADLQSISLPEDLDMSKGLVLSGRGPVWLYGYLTHLAHPFAWVGIHDPRLNGAIVVEGHQTHAPTIGEIVEMA